MAPRKDYTKEQILEAINAVTGGLPVATAAKQFGIPRTTLLSKTSGKIPVDCRMGPSTILTSQEETLLVQWILSLAKVHQPVTKEQLLDSVQLILLQQKRANPFTDGRPGRKWFESFLKRHPKITQRVSQNLTPSRENVTEEQIRQWFDEVKTYLESKQLTNILDDPTRVFNCDESAFFLQPKGGKVLAKRGASSVYTAGTNDDKENLTVLVTANAAGDLGPPMIVFKYERIPAHIAQSVYNVDKTWGIGRSESGWMCGSTFYEYITNVFVKWLDNHQIKRPIVLFVDGHVSHMTMPLSKFCLQNGIEVLALYPNSTHLLQPMDVSVFKALKVYWKQSVRNWHVENYGNKLRKEHFSVVFSQALKDITKETIQNGFEACGLSPFNVEKVKYSNISSNKKSTKKVHNSRSKEGLIILEKYIHAEKLKTFKDNLNSTWKGDLIDLSLFEVWQKMYSDTVSDTDLERQKTESDVQPIETDETEVNSDIISQPGCSGLHVNKSVSTSQISPKVVVQHLEIIKPSVVEMNTSPLKELCVPQDFSSPVKFISASPLKILQEDSTPLKVSDLKENVPTPFKKALFFPEETSSAKKKRKEKIPCAITSEKWQEYHSKKQEEKQRKETEKQKRAEERKRKKEEKENKQRDKKAKSKGIKKKTNHDSESSVENEEWIESGDSLDDIDMTQNENEGNSDESQSLERSDVSYDNIQVGDFILTKFLGGKRHTIFYRYICVIETKNSANNIEVVSLKSINKTSFKLVETDTSIISLNDIIRKLPQPELQAVGDRVKYIFNEEVDIFEA